MKRTTLLHIVFCMLLLMGVAALYAQTLVFDRGLPTANLNNAAGSNRSNVAWGFGYDPGPPPEGNNEWFTGDDFILPVNSPGKVWRVTKVRTWGVAGAAGDPGFKLGDRYYRITLYGAGGHGAIVPIKSGDIGLGTNTALIPGTTTPNPDITFTPVQYAGGLDYQTGSGAFAQIWQTDFANLDWLVPGGRLIRFGVHGLVYDNVNRVWFNHASNAARSGSTQQGADDLMRYFYIHNLVTGDGTWDSNGLGWDKSSDINVQVWAEEVDLPLPGFPVDLNGTYICPRVTDVGLGYPGIAMAATVADSYYGQVVERSGPGSPVWNPNVLEGTHTPFSDPVKPPKLLVIPTIGVSCAADLDLTGTWDATDDFGIALIDGVITAGVRVTHTGTGYKFQLASRLVAWPWTLSLGGTPYTANADETKFHVRLHVYTDGGLLAYVTPLNGTNAGKEQDLAQSGQWVPSPALGSNVGFTAGFTSMTDKPLAVARVSNFQTNKPANVMYLFADDPYVKSAELIGYRFGMANMAQSAFGYQAWLSAAGVQTYSGGSYTAFPYPFHIQPFGTAIDGQVGYGAPPVFVDSSLALYAFSPTSEGTAWMRLNTDSGPPDNFLTRWTNTFGQPIVPYDFLSDPAYLEVSNWVVVDYTAAALTGLTATQSHGNVLNGALPVMLGNLLITVDARDVDPLTNGSGLAKRPLISIPEFGIVNQPMYSGTGNTFCYDYTVTSLTPCGVANITITAEDDAGNAATPATGTLTVNTTNVSITVALAGGFAAGPVTREVLFTVGGTGGSNPPITVAKNVTFSSGVGTTTINALDTPTIPCGAAITHISAKDRLHTLRQTIALGGSSPSFTASFTGGDALIGGDANGDNLIDILDFGMLAWKFGTNFGTGNTPIGNPYNNSTNPHPDFSGNGLVGSEDYTFIATGFLTIGDAQVGNYGPQGTPKEKATVKEMLDAGIKIAPFFDLNRDGWVTYDEIATWLSKNHGGGGVIGRR